MVRPMQIARLRVHDQPASAGITPALALALVLALVLVLLLGGCAAGPPRGGSGVGNGNGTGTGNDTARSPRPPLPAERDGPEANPPADLARVPDAEPKLEPIRTGGPNKPYEALGQTYVPITQDKPFSERGLASWYGKKFHGRRTASGEVYDMYAMTAAHPTLPIPSYARLRNPANGQAVVVRINDRGPFHAGRIVDLSYTAALKLGVLRGVAPVELQRITFDDIRSGAWRRDGPVLASATAPVVVAEAAPQPVPMPARQSAPLATPPPASLPLLTSVPAPVPPPASEPASTPATTAPSAVTDAPSARAFTGPARGFWVQLAAFRQQDGAETFRRRVANDVDWLTPLLAVFADASVYRLQAGPYPSRDEARSVAERVRDALQLVPVIVERR